MPAYIGAVGAQAAHLLEEYRTGFNREFPPVLGAQPRSSNAFLLFNIVSLLVFSVGAVGLLRGWRPAVVVALFLALGGGVLNGLAHVAFAARAGAIFQASTPRPSCSAQAARYLAFRLLRRSNTANVA